MSMFFNTENMGEEKERYVDKLTETDTSTAVGARVNRARSNQVIKKEEPWIDEYSLSNLILIQYRKRLKKDANGFLIWWGSGEQVHSEARSSKRLRKDYHGCRSLKRPNN